MSRDIYSVIVGSGCYLPTRRVPNDDFLNHRFFDAEGSPIDPAQNEKTVRKFGEITEITERRYVTDDVVASDMALVAARSALEAWGGDSESLDYIIVAHNFGDVLADNRRSDMVPTLAARVKERLEIANPSCVAYDLPFGCPGWLQAVIQANYYLRSGDARRALVIGSETLSRVCDPHDRDSMIYADGAGAVVLEAREAERPVGVLTHATRSDTLHHARLLKMDRTYGPDCPSEALYLKMRGRKLYEYALTNVPGVIVDSLQKAGLELGAIDKILIHQANGKMDRAIAKRLGQRCGTTLETDRLVPMTVSWLGNSSVATLPTLLDLILRGQLEDHTLRSGDNVIFASVGAGMNINSLVYRCA